MAARRSVYVSLYSFDLNAVVLTVGARDSGSLSTPFCRPLEMAASRRTRDEVDALMGEINCKRLLRPERVGKETLKFQCQACGEKFVRHTTAQNHYEPCQKRLRRAPAARAKGAAGGHDGAGPSSRPPTPFSSATLGADVSGVPDGAGPSSPQPIPPALACHPNHPANSDDLFAVRTPPCIPAL